MPVRKTTTTTTTKPAPVKKATKATTARKTVAKSNPVTTRTSQPTNQSNRQNISKPGTSIGRVGNLGGDPEMRFSPNGTAVCNVSLAYEPYNFETKEKGEVVWYRLVGFGALAEQMVACLESGMRVLAIGRPQLNNWTDDDGEYHESKEILLDGIGPDIRFANVSVERMNRRGPTNYNARSNRDQYEDEEPF